MLIWSPANDYWRGVLRLFEGPVWCLPPAREPCAFRLHTLSGEGGFSLNHYLIVYRSVTQAQMAGRTLTRAGIVNQIQRTPAGLTERGCSYSVRVPERYIQQAVGLLRGMRPSYYKIFQSSGGSYSEATFS